MLDGLAFSTVEEVPEGMNHPKETALPEAGELVSYFDKTYVNGTFRMLPAVENNDVRLRQTLLLYLPAIGNVHDATQADGPRTNNHCEG